MCRITDISYPSSDGVHTVYAREWAPESGDAKAVVQIVHGMAEYIDRYDDFARFLARHGYIVVGEDHLGHGKTAKGDFGFFAEEDGGKKMTEDVHTLQVTTQARYPGLPFYLLGHSLGSFFARYQMITWPGSVDGVILSGTGHVPAAAVKALRPVIRRMTKKHGKRAASPMSFAMFNKKFAPNRTAADWITRDEAIVDAYVVDPLTQIPTTYGMASDLVPLAEVLVSSEGLKRMDKTTPVYLFSGDRDPVGGEGKGVMKTYNTFRTLDFEDVSFKLYPEGRHEMLNEINRDEVYTDVLAWLDKHVEAWQAKRG